MSVHRILSATVALLALALAGCGPENLVSGPDSDPARPATAPAAETANEASSGASEYYSGVQPIAPAEPSPPTEQTFSDPGQLFVPQYRPGVEPDAAPPRASADLKKKPKHDGFHSHPARPAGKRPRFLSRDDSIGLRAHDVNTHCHARGATMAAAVDGVSFRQLTEYCWAASGHGVFYVGSAQLEGASSQRQVSWKGVDKQWRQCYPLNGRAVGYCQQTTYGHFEQRAGGKKRQLGIWTALRVYYNGYAECASIRINQWRDCS